jgi:hypothetical protein
MSKNTPFKCKFSYRQIPSLSKRYLDSQINRRSELRDDFLAEVVSHTKKDGFMKRENFLALYRWKSERTIGLAQKNSNFLIEESTKISLLAKTEEVRIGALMILRGVDWPVASAILHWVSCDPYPLLDFRALWSLSINKTPTYNFDFWWSYVEICRKIADQAGVSMRDLDRALWQFSDENQ